MNRKVLIWILFAAVLGGVGYALITPQPAVNKKIDSAELTQLQKSGAWVVDVRKNSEFIQGHIPNSLNVPLDQLAQTASTWSKTQPVIVYCATGARSAQAASYLAGQGFKKVYDLAGGAASWSGPVAGGQANASAPTGAGVVKTNGKPVFIDFASST
jgi:rhodanese-related sulfurtransferase